MQELGGDKEHSLFREQQEVCYGWITAGNGGLRLVEKEWIRGKLQETTEGRESGARSAPLSCPVREFSQSS